MWLIKSQLCFSQISFMEVMASRDQFNELVWPSLSADFCSEAGLKHIL